MTGTELHNQTQRLSFPYLNSIGLNGEEEGQERLPLLLHNGELHVPCPKWSPALGGLGLEQPALQHTQDLDALIAGRSVAVAGTRAMREKVGGGEGKSGVADNKDCCSGSRVTRDEGVQGAVGEGPLKGMGPKELTLGEVE